MACLLVAGTPRPAPAAPPPGSAPSATSPATSPATAPAARPPRVAYITPAAEQPEAAARTTIFYDDFSDTRNLAGRYYEYTNPKNSFVPDAVGGLGGSPAMRQTFAKGQVTGGTLKVLFGQNPFRNRGLRRDETFREVYWRLYLKHQDGWQGAPAKLARVTCLASENWRQGLIAHVWSMPKKPLLVIDPATGIVDSRNVTTRYNDFEHLHWLGSRRGTTPIFSAEESGRWVCVESHVKLNTPGKKDGLFELFVDGQPEAARDGLDWHGRWQEFAINAVFFENYWNDGAVKEESRWFDNLVVATAPVGPITATVPPEVHLAGRAGAPGPVEVQLLAAPDEKAAPVWSGQARGARFTIPARLEPGKVYWLRVRDKTDKTDKGDKGDKADQDAPWSPPHAPFKAGK